MKIAIVSDLHGNLDALSAFSESFDELWVLGDLVGFGPQPAEVVEAMRAKASIVVQSNHDRAVGHNDDSRWTPTFRALAEASRCHASACLSEEQKQYLRDLPVATRIERGGTSFFLVHATPSDPHYGHLTSNADGWASELENVDGTWCSSVTLTCPSSGGSETGPSSIPVASVSREAVNRAPATQCGKTVTSNFAASSTQSRRRSGSSALSDTRPQSKLN